jgi:hypothetical protein
MSNIQAFSSRRSFWQTVLLYGTLHFLVMSYGAFVIEFNMGGCQWIIPAFFMTLPVVLAILSLRRIGAGTAVFLPYALIGFFAVYYQDYVNSHIMLSIWGAVAWAIAGPLVGLAADLTYHFLPPTISEKWRAVGVGMTIGVGTYLTPLIVMSFFYAPHPPESHYYQFTDGIAYSLSWLVVNGGLSGYIAYMLTERNRDPQELFQADQHV